MLRHLATEVGDEWRRLAHCLGIRSIRQEAVIRNGNTKARQDAVYDMLTSWMKKMPRAANKVGYNNTSTTGRPSTGKRKDVYTCFRYIIHPNYFSTF